MTNAYSANLAALKARPACKLKEIGDQWRTPERLYIGINAKFGPFTLDLFTDGDNSKCVNFYTAEQNALLQDWASDLKQFGGSAFANPPYSRESKDNNGEYVTGMRHIIDKALAERDAGARIVFLIKATPSETWWPEEADHIVFIKGRIGFDVPEWFVPEEGSAAKAGAGFASAVAIFDKNWRGEKMSYISRDELEFIGQHWLDAVDAKASKLVAAQLEAMRAAEPTAAVDDVVPSVMVEPEANTIEPEPEAEPEPEQPACVASIDDVNCPEIPEGCSVANCASEEQETAPELAYAVTDAPETVTEGIVDELPTVRAEIDDLRVLSALEAAFGLKEQYSFSESRVAHTWVADSFEHPTIIIVPADVLAKAISAYQRHQAVELIDNSGCTESQVERLHAVSEDVLSGYSEWFIPVMRELIERVKENGLENIREMRVEMRLIAERLMREFFNPRSGAPSLGCSEDQIQGLCDVLWEVENGYFGPFDKSDLMPVFNQLVGYVRATNPAHARKMRLYLRSNTKINGNVIFPEQVNQ
ncbi:phage N-6-adenine-methyltransferase [Plesiomonas shigelloides]|uniref:phage N-6-adenine-methyltransferase n=1 Tax=Plesiomonas shigelloides TaxID=703 RepID=UPI001E351A05|nr:phage N-6-adenine-methyltransferase [Plesiomonas shigelloides]